MRSHIKSLALILSVALLTSGCAVGFDAATNQQKASGNGRTANVGDIQVRNALIVRDKQNPTRGTFVGTIINNSQEPEAITTFFFDDQIFNLKGLEIESGGSLILPSPTSSKRIDLELKPNSVAGSYTSFYLGFKNNAEIKFRTDFKKLKHPTESDQWPLLVEDNDGVYADVIVGSVTVD